MVTHITKSGKAKCSAYPASGRCQKVAKVKVFDFNLGRERFLCVQHADELVSAGKARCVENSQNGYLANQQFVFGLGNTTQYRKVE